ncbi:MAG: histidine phosphatase family protein, partial [Micromonosporaceae bacterium]
MTDLVLTRHGETIWHSGNRYAGRTDIPLNQCGQQQAQLLGRWAKRARLDAVWVSPLARARDTAAPAAQAAGVRPHADDRLVELDFGDAEGLTGGQMRERFPEVRAAFESDPVEHHLPGGEDPRDALQRAISCLTEIVGLFPDGRVLIVWHGTIHRLVLCHLLGMPLR